MWSVQSSQRRMRHAARGKEELLVAGAKVIAQRGLDQTRFADIADSTGVAISTLQYYFGSREDLLIAVIEHAIQEEARRLREIADQSADPRQRLSRLIMFTLGETDTFPESRLLWKEVWRAAVRHSELRELYNQMYAAWLVSFQDALQAGVEQGFVPRTINIRDAAVQILALIDGLATPLLIEYPALDRGKMQQLALDVVVTVLKIDYSLPETA